MDTSSVRKIRGRTLAIWTAVNFALSLYVIYASSHVAELVDVGQADAGAASMVVMVAASLVGLICAVRAVLSFHDAGGATVAAAALVLAALVNAGCLALTVATLAHLSSLT